MLTRSFNIFLIEPLTCVFENNDGGKIYIGNIFAAKDIQILQKQGIRAVLTAADIPGFKYTQWVKFHLMIPVNDLPFANISIHFPRAIKFIEQCRQQTNILVHCHAGISRSTSFVIVYLMTKYKIPLFKCIEQIRKKRRIINPNYGFIRQLEEYERYLRFDQTVEPFVKELYQVSNNEEINVGDWESKEKKDKRQAKSEYKIQKKKIVEKEQKKKQLNKNQKLNMKQIEKFQQQNNNVKQIQKKIEEKKYQNKIQYVKGQLEGLLAPNYHYMTKAPYSKSLNKNMIGGGTLKNNFLFKS